MSAFGLASKHLDLDGLTYAYVDEGAGPPVVLVHGNPSWSYYFRSLLTRLPAAGYRALAPDHIGMGRSSKPSRAAYDHTLERRISDFGRWMAALELSEPVTLVVHDWGGAIALGWAVEHPEAVAGLVLLNTAAFPMPAGTGMPLGLRLARTPALGRLAVCYANAFAVGASVLGVRHRMPRAVRRGYLEPYDTPAHRVAVHEFVRDIPVRPGDPAYARLRRTEQLLPAFAADRPVLLCWGMRDPVLDAAILDHWRQLIPAAEVHCFADAGHYVLEDAGAQIEPLVLSFLARTADASTTA